MMFDVEHGQDQAADLYPAFGADVSPLALMEFAGEGLISVASSKDRQRSRLASPRSDLLCHHAYINLRNLLAIQLL
ncbi:hypothetical protein CIW54_28845 [Paraburkholderia sp. T12-10]|nr:hypothetical protein CIW54_28845 [Paraburkholderia sp. T12-10]